MKPIKMLGLAMLAALMAMAFLGASSATAESTQLCKEDVLEEACPEGKAVTHVHEETLAGKPGVLLNGVGNVLCAVLFLSTEVLGLGAPQVIHGHFTYSSCVRHKVFGGTEPCTVTEVSKSSLIEVLKEGHELAKVTGTGQVEVKCGTFIECTYNGEGLIGHALGALLPGEETLGGVLIDNAVTTKVGEGICPKTAELDLTTTPLEDVYIAK